MTGDGTNPRSTSVPVVSAAALRGEVSSLCAVGNRFVGTAGEAAAAAHIFDRLQAVGVEDLNIEGVETLVYRPQHAALTAPDLPALEFPASGLQFTAAAQIRAPGVYLGTPRTMEDVTALLRAGIDVRGRVVVFQSYWPYLIGPYLVEAGASALVNVGYAPDGLLAHYTAQLYPPAEAPDFDGAPLAVPGVSLEREAGGVLAALAGAGRELIVDHAAHYVRGSSGNVVGVVPGMTSPHEYVVVGAHYDSQADGVGACDNASGVAALIELARWCVRHPRARSVVFVAFAAEEQGFRGALAYCRAHRDELERTRGMICLDALAWRYPARRAVHADPSILDYASARAAEVGWVVDERVDASLLRGSDHNPFIDADVPAAWFWQYPPQHPYYHSAGDTVELVDFGAAAHAAVAAGYTAFSLADERGNPVGRARPTRRWLDLRPA